MVVVFDLDGTLIESEQIWADVRRQFVVARGGTWQQQAQERMIGMRSTEWAQYIHDDLGVGLPPAQIAAQVVEAVKARLVRCCPGLKARWNGSRGIFLSGSRPRQRCPLLAPFWNGPVG